MIIVLKLKCFFHQPHGFDYRIAVMKGQCRFITFIRHCIGFFNYDTIVQSKRDDNGAQFMIPVCSLGYGIQT